MQHFWNTLGWIWSRKIYIAVSLGSALFFFVMFFPFNDLSLAISSTVARMTNNQVYVQASQLNFHLIPKPAISATDIEIETALPPIKAQWAKFTPGLFSLLFSAPTLIKASGGDPQAMKDMSSALGMSFDAQGIWGGELELSVGSGKKGERGPRSRIYLSLEEVNLAEVQRWSQISTAFSGQASFETDILVSPSFEEQPDGEYNIHISKFNLPAGTVSVPMGEATFPISVPHLTLAEVVLKGRLVGGNLVIEQGQFGRPQDPLNGRIKGQLGLRFQPSGQGIVPQFGSYNLTVDLNTSATVQKELSFAFFPLEPAKQPVAGGGARYLFRATGQGIGMAYVPNITRINSF